MQNMRCDRCKHWDTEPGDWELGKSGLRECSAVRTWWDVADEASERLAQEIGKHRYDNDAPEDEFEAVRREALQRSRACVSDGSQYTAALLTGPDFFCALFTEKQ